MASAKSKELGLYEHNANSYNIVEDAFKKNKEVVGIVHATGTGKSYIALQLTYDNKDKRIVYVVPSYGIIEHLKEVINSNSNLNLERDFPNLEFRTYQSLVNLSKEEIASISCDLLILDEFHHIGAPVWGARINTFIKTHPNLKIFGMTAYTVRDRNTIYERDMANPDTDELFSNKIVSRYDLCDAMIDGVLPKPIYRCAYVELLETEKKLEERIIKKCNPESNEYKTYMNILKDTKRRIQESPSIPNLLKKNIKPHGKYIYFCPPMSQENTNDIETIKRQAMEWFKEFVPEEDIVFYTTTSKMGIDGEKNRDAFYNDVTLDGKDAHNKLQVMFAINQYNEGVHAPNIDGVILGRGTSSDIVYFEQIGRALSVRGDTKEEYEKLEQYSLEQLISMCKKRDIIIKENEDKKEIIGKLLAPVIIDLTCNFEFIKELENNLQNRIKEIQNKSIGNPRDIKISNAIFDIIIENKDLYVMLKYVMDRLTISWEDHYELAKNYYDHHGNLLVPRNFKTINGYTYDESGVNLGSWISSQKVNYDNLSDEKKQMLIKIEFVLNAHDVQWEKMYALAQKYYEYHGDLLVPQNFKTINGYEYDEEGINLGPWIASQRRYYDNLSENRKQMLGKIGFVLNAHDVQWEKMYALAQKYNEYHGNILVPVNFKTIDGYTYNELGVNLGLWISHQRVDYDNLSEERKQLLIKIGFVLNAHDVQWQKMYNLAQKYNEYHGNLLVPVNFKTIDGYTYNELGVNLGRWITNQRRYYTNLSEERKELLKDIGFVLNAIDDKWQKMYDLAKKYYEYHGDLLIPQSFKTINGFEYDESGINLGRWIASKRIKYCNLSNEYKKLLLKIGMVINIKKNKEDIHLICLNNNIDEKVNKAILKAISIQELESKISFLKENNISITDDKGLLIDIFRMSSIDMQQKYRISLEELIDKYYFKKEEGKSI